MLDLSIANSVEAHAFLHSRRLDDILERGRISIVGNGDEGDVERQLFVEHIHDGDALRVINSCRMAQNAIHHAENGGVSSNTERESNDRRNAEAGQADKLPEGVTQIVEDHGRRLSHRLSTHANGQGAPYKCR